MSHSVFPRNRSTIAPCLPKPAKEPPAGPDWIHEIKHDGFRILARRNGNGVRLYTRNGSNFVDRFPRIVEAVATCRCSPASSTARRSWSTNAALRSLTCSAPGATTMPPCCAPLIW